MFVSYAIRIFKLAKKQIMKFYPLLISIILTIGALAQEKDNPQHIVFISPNYELQFPFGDMKKDFGVNSNLGLEISIITNKNLYLSFNSSFIFGTNIKDSTLLNHLMDDNFNIIDQNGQISDILLHERGFNTNLKVGYLWPILHQKSGLLGYGTFGFHQHKIRIDVKNQSVPQLNDENKKMYDQLTSGLSTSTFLGYLNISKKNGIHFYTGLEWSRAFTKNQRSFNYIAQGPIDKLRNDSFLGLKFGWIIPISKRSTQEYFYF